MEFDRFAFHESNTINQFIDYGFYADTSRKFQKTFFEGDFDLRMLKTEVNQGIITPEEGRTYNVRLVMKDYFGNATTLNIPLIYQKQKEVEAKANTGKYVDYLRDYRAFPNRY